MQYRPVLARALLGLLLIGALGQVDAASSSRARQKSRAEGERAELQQKLKALKNDINKTESARDKASDALDDSEQAISEANRSLNDLQLEQNQTEARLNLLIEEKNYLNVKVEKQKKQLSDFLVRQYIRGDSDRIKLLLSGDNPSRINRELQYLGYISQTQAKLIANLHVSLIEAEKNADEALEAKTELDEIAEEKRAHKLALENEKKKRSSLLVRLADKLHSQKKEASNLQKDEQRLSSLVSRLNSLLEEQNRARRAKAAQVEKQRREKLLAEKERNRQNQKSGKIVNKNAIDDDQAPSKSSMTIAQTPDEGDDDGKEFSRLKGHLRLPVKGELIARFGSKRGDGPSWKGLFIKAAEGAEIKAIAAGKVVFAKWLRGFGNIIILDHGGQYLSLYSNNQAVLRHEGDSVKTGETIANAGNSGGNEESGLYFELRHQGRVFDPLTWVGKSP
jgi:septal ring factor EnvC (AmiA/AmiB activator)